MFAQTQPSAPVAHKYLATVDWTDGSSATAEDTNLRRLRKRIRRNFNGETTDWGMAPGAAVGKWEIFDHAGNSVADGETETERRETLRMARWELRLAEASVAYDTRDPRRVARFDAAQEAVRALTRAEGRAS